MELSIKNRNYKNLVRQAEGAFLKKEFLEAFLIQSCVIEGVLKNYASIKLFSLSASRSLVFSKKFENFEFARLVDDLFLTGNIDKNMYEKLNKYRKKRNNVIHKLLEYENKKELDKELGAAYKLGKDMKSFIVKDITIQSKNSGKTASEIEAEIQNLQCLLKSYQSQLEELEAEA